MEPCYVSPLTGRRSVASTARPFTLLFSPSSPMFATRKKRDFPVCRSTANPTPSPQLIFRASARGNLFSPLFLFSLFPFCRACRAGPFFFQSVRQFLVQRHLVFHPRQRLLLPFFSPPPDKWAQMGSFFFPSESTRLDHRGVFLAARRAMCFLLFSPYFGYFSYPPKLPSCRVEDDPWNLVRPHLSPPSPLSFLLEYVSRSFPGYRDNKPRK